MMITLILVNIRAACITELGQLSIWGNLEHYTGKILESMFSLLNNFSLQLYQLEKAT